MALVKLNLNGTTKSFDDSAVETLCSHPNKMTLYRYGPVVFADRAGTATIATTDQVQTVANYVPPKVTNMDQYSGSCGYYDNWSTGAGALSCYRNATGMGNGNYRCWLNSFDNARPMLIYIPGDITSFGTYATKINSTSKGPIPYPGTESTSVFRYASRQVVPLASGVSGYMTCTVWGTLCIVNWQGIATTAHGDGFTIAQLPSGCRPPMTVSYTMANHESTYFMTGEINTGGAVLLWNKNSAVNCSNAWGCCIFSTSNGTNGNIYVSQNLKMNGTTKELLIPNSYTVKYASVSASGINWHFWRMGKLVFGSGVSYNAGSSALNGATVCTIPVGFRPSAVSYGAGAGWVYGTNHPVAGERLAYNINTNGAIQAWSKGLLAPTNCGFNGYWLSSEAMPA